MRKYLQITYLEKGLYPDYIKNSYNATVKSLLVKMAEWVNAVLNSSHDHIKIILNHRTTIIENHLKMIKTEVL